MTARSFLILFLFLAGTTVCAADQVTCNNQSVEKFSSGLLWKISHQGAHSGFLFGTIHLADPQVTALPGIVKRSMQESRHFAMEVETHPLARSTYIERSHFNDGRNLEQLLGMEEFQQLSQLVSRHYGIDSQLLRPLKPWAVFMLLSQPPATGEKTLDQVLAEQAEQGGLEISGLESMDEMLDAVDAMPMKDQLVILKDTMLEFDKLEAQLEELRKAYLQRDLATMMAINHRQHDDEALFHRFMDRLLYQRNANMLKRIESLLRQGKVFIAVGALHLPGKRGLLCGLQARNYSLDRLY